MHAGAAHRVHTHAHLRCADHVHVDHVAEVTDVGAEKVVAMRRRSLQGLGMRHALHAFETRFEQAIGLGFDPACDGLTRRPAVRRVVFETAIARRVV